MNKLKVGTRLALGFGVVLLMLALSIGLSISRMAQLNTDMNSIVQEQYPKVLDAQAILDANNKIARSLRNSLLIADAALAAKEIDVIRGKLKDIEAIYGQLDTSIRTPDSRALLNAMLESRGKFQTSLDEVIRLQQTGDKEAAIGYMLGTMRGTQLAYMDSITALIKRQSDRMEHARLRAEDSYVSSRNLFLMLGACALLAGVVAAWVITTALLKQLGGEPDYAASIAGSIAAGDLTVPVVTRAGDTGSLLFAMSRMRESLTQIVGEVRGGTDAIATASTQIAVGNMDLSTRTEQQASALEETASSMEELTATVKQNASNARQANEMALSASNVAVRGGAVVGQVVHTMGAISEASKKIVEIISVIDGIAFQTNILALNAAVEAARAGEQGRGFAVVASEVRNLAHRSTAAAKEIKLLIENSVMQVGEGSRLVNEAGMTMAEIVDSIARVTGVMGEITLATQEQGIGIEQVNQAVGQMDQVTQQNAALVEEAAAAAESLQEQAAALARVVSVFQLDGQAPRISATPALAPASALAPTPRQPPVKPLRATPARAPIAAMPASLPPRHKANVIALRPALAGRPGMAAAVGDWEEF